MQHSTVCIAAIGVEKLASVGPEHLCDIIQREFEVLFLSTQGRDIFG